MGAGLDPVRKTLRRAPAVISYAMLLACVAWGAAAAVGGQWLWVAAAVWLIFVVLIDLWERSRRRDGRHVQPVAEILWSVTAVATLVAVFGWWALAAGVIVLTPLLSRTTRTS